jgi:hypothetical protein
MVVHTKKITMALFAIVIASSLLVVTSFVGSAFAAKKKVNKEEEDDTYSTFPTISLGKDSLRASSAGDSSGDTGDTSGISAKDLKSLSKCQSSAAADGDLTLAEERECYRLSCNDYD